MSIDLAIGISILWGAVSIPLSWLNPLKFSNDEIATKILVYGLAPFIFFSVVFFVIGAFMRRRSQRDEAGKKLKKAEMMYRTLIANGKYYRTLPVEYQKEARRLYGVASDALEKGAHEEAGIKAQQLITLIRNRQPSRFELDRQVGERGGIEGMI